MTITLPANTANLATIANLTLTGQTLINPPQTSLNGGTGLLLNQYYYDNFGPARNIGFIGTPVNGSFITLRANVTGQASLQFPQSNRIGQVGTVTGLNLNLGNQEISWVYANTNWWLADSTSAVNNFSASRAPAVTDDFTSGYAVGSMWVNTGAKQPYECVANTIGAASWFVLGSGSAGGFSIATGQSAPIGNVSFFQTGIATKPVLAYYDTGWGNRFVDNAIYAKRFFFLLPGATTNTTVIGGAASSAGGTISTLGTEWFGKMTNCYGSSPYGNIGFAASTLDFYRGSITNGANGFFFTSQFALTGNGQSDFGNPSGCRVFVGLSRSSSIPTNSNVPSEDLIGLSYVWATGGSQPDSYYPTWQTLSVSGTSATFTTGACPMNFGTGWFRFSMYCQPYPNNTFVNWQLDDLLNLTGCVGTMTGYLPIGSTPIGPAVEMNTVSGNKNFLIGSIYTEAAR